jgi:hypothetical protein
MSVAKSDEPIIEEEMQINSSTIKKPEGDLIKQPEAGGNDLDDLSQDIFDNFGLAV